MFTSLSQFLLVRQKEKKDVLYFLILFFLIGAGMALGRGTAEALFFKRYGIEYLPIMYIALGALLVFVTSLYASVADRFPAESLLKKICFILSVVLLLCWLMMEYLHWEGIYPFYFLIYEVASEILLVHGALYVSQNFDTLQSKRLIPLILAGAQVGTIAGGAVLAVFSLVINVESLLLIWFASLSLSYLLVQQRHRVLGLSPYYRFHKRRGGILKQTRDQFVQCFRYARTSQLMKAMSWTLFFTVIVFYLLAFSVNKIYTGHFSTEAELSSFFGVLVSLNGIVALIIQLFFTNRIIDRLGIRTSNLVFPSLTLLSFSFLYASITLPAAILGSFVKDALMPALRNPIRNMFFNAIPNNLRGRAHAFSIGVVLPVAMMLTGGLLIFIQQEESLSLIVLFGLIMSVPLFLASYKMNKAYGPAILEELRKKVFVPDENLKLAMKYEKRKILDSLIISGKSENEEVRYAAAEALLELYSDSEMDAVIDIIKTLQVAKQDVLLQQIMPLVSAEERHTLYKLFKQGDLHLEATLLTTMVNQKDQVALNYCQSALNNPNPRVLSAGIYGILSYGCQEQEIDAIKKWADLLHSDQPAHVLSGLDVFQLYPSTHLLGEVYLFLQSSNYRVQQAAVNTLSNWPKDEAEDLNRIVDKLILHYEPIIRFKALSISNLLSRTKQKKLAGTCLQDNHPMIREEAARIMFGQEEEILFIANWLCHSNFSPLAKEAVLNVFFAFEPAVGTLQNVAYDTLLDAEEFYIAHQGINDTLTKEQLKNPVIEVLLILLLERCQQSLDNTLNVLKHYEDKETIGVIYSGIKSEDPMHVANACEALSMLSDDVLSRRIITLIENISVAKSQYCLIDNNVFEKYLFHKTLDWCVKRNDNWLKLCAKEAYLVT